MTDSTVITTHFAMSLVNAPKADIDQYYPNIFRLRTRLSKRWADCRARYEDGRAFPSGVND